MRVGVYTIAINNLSDVREWAETTADADYRLILDLGSTDETDRHLEEQGCTVHRVQCPNMRSDDALNAAIAFMPSNIDVCFRVDMNERPHQGWMAALLRDWEDGNPVLSPLISASPSKRYYEPRIHGRDDFRWSGPIHETLMWRNHETFTSEPSAIVVDRRDELRTSDIAILKEAVCEASSAGRIFRYAEALLLAGYLQDGLSEIPRHVAMGGPPHETAYLWRLVASIDEVSAPQSLTEAARLYPCASNYLAFAEYHFHDRNWGQAYLSCQYALSLLRSQPQKVLLYTDDPRLREPKLHDIAAVAAFNLWDFEAAYGHAVEALRRAPQDPVLINQLNEIQARLSAGATLDPDMVPMRSVAVEEPRPLSLQIIRRIDTPDVSPDVSPASQMEAAS